MEDFYKGKKILRTDAELAAKSLKDRLLGNAPPNMMAVSSVAVEFYECFQDFVLVVFHTSPFMVIPTEWEGYMVDSHNLYEGKESRRYYRFMKQSNN